ncbi:MAG: glycosyltransferase [Dehalococcoidia bacterium]|nr:glycosyltransferase [Dehalococcoidia bacterium]
MVKKGAIASTIPPLITVGLVVFIMPGWTTLICLAVALLGASYFWVSVVRGRQTGRIETARPHPIPSMLSVFTLVLPFLFAGVILFQGIFGAMTAISAILLASLALAFFYYFLTIPLAIYHKYLEAKAAARPLQSYPVISIIVPAYNEEKCLARTIESILEADYPHKDVIIVDDGSTDKTYNIAMRYKEMGVRVFHRPNGGKFAALNYGLLFAKGEIIVTIDADSLIARNAIKEMARSFQDKRAFGVAGNIKVWNRNNFLTKCQALEYITGINIFRRAFDVFGAVSIVPGALGAFRKEVVEGSGFYDPYTLTEDFDITVKVLKAGGIVQACDARAYTEAPQNLKDLYRQRMRWYRGNFQTIFRHWDAFVNPRFGSLHRLAFPWALFSMLGVPLAGIVVIVSAIMAILDGNGMQVLYMFGLFLLLQFWLSILAIQLDDEDMKLAIYSPLFVIGYKHLSDFFCLKSMIDVVTRRKVTWTRARRIDFEAESVKG